jgi:hypothetical protein
MNDYEVAIEMWSKMSAFEQMDLYYARMAQVHDGLNAIFTQLALYLSIVTGYLVVAYAAGAQLTKSQVCIATVTYLFGAAMMVGGMFSGYLLIDYTLTINAHWLEFVGATSGAAQFREEVAFGIVDILAGLMLIMGTLAPLYFMWGVRHPKTE